jgi:hypothetical protein
MRKIETNAKLLFDENKLTREWHIGFIPISSNEQLSV